MLASLTTAMTALALTAAAPQAPQGQTKWEADYGKALQQTKADQRPLLIVLDNPAAKDEQLSPALTGKENAKLLKSYDLCRVNVETEYGKKVAEAFKATEFPYVAIIDKSGEVILHSQVGGISADAWKATLTKHQEGERAVRYTVAKPITTSQPVLLDSSEYIQSTPVYDSPQPTYYNPPADCPNCRRGY